MVVAYFIPCNGKLTVTFVLLTWPTWEITGLWCFLQFRQRHLNKDIVYKRKHIFYIFWFWKYHLPRRLYHTALLPLDLLSPKATWRSLSGVKWLAVGSFHSTPIYQFYSYSHPSLIIHHLIQLLLSLWSIPKELKRYSSISFPFSLPLCHTCNT